MFMSLSLTPKLMNIHEHGANALFQRYPELWLVSRVVIQWLKLHSRQHFLDWAPEKKIAWRHLWLLLFHTFKLIKNGNSVSVDYFLFGGQFERVRKCKKNVEYDRVRHTNIESVLSNITKVKIKSLLGPCDIEKHLGIGLIPLIFLNTNWRKKKNNLKQTHWNLYMK